MLKTFNISDYKVKFAVYASQLYYLFYMAQIKNQRVRFYICYLYQQLTMRRFCISLECIV